MKTKLFAIAAISVFFTACRKTDAPLQDSYDLNPVAAKPKTTPDPLNFTAPNVYPEGVVYDPYNDRFLVSSISMGTIGSVNRAGIYSPFIQDAALASTAGMEIDKARKRLLVTSSTVTGSVAQLASYDLNTAARIFIVDLKMVANDGAPHLANDVAVDNQGNAYVTDSYAGIIYKVDRFGNASVFYRNPAFTPAPGGFGFNGIEYGNNQGSYLLVGHTAQNKIIKISVDNPASVSTVQFNPSIVSPDGLLLSKDGKQLIVVNNTVQFPGSKVMTFETTNNWASATSTGTFDTGIVYPTTVTSDGKTEYVLYSYLHMLFAGQPRETFTLQPLPFSSNHPF